MKFGASMFFTDYSMGAAELEGAVTLLRQGLEPTDVLASLQDLPAFDTERAFDLYQRLLAPAEALLTGVQRLIVVPDQALQSLGHGDGRCVVFRADIHLQCKPLLEGHPEFSAFHPGKHLDRRGWGLFQRVRRKLEAARSVVRIETVRGAGYRLTAGTQESAQ